MRSINDLIRPSVGSRVLNAQGSATKLRRIGGLSDWLEAGVAAPAETRTRVEGQIAVYVEGAEAIGGKWGRRMGIAIGAGAFVLIIAIRLLI